MKNRTRIIQLVILGVFFSTVLTSLPALARADWGDRDRDRGGDRDRRHDRDKDRDRGWDRHDRDDRRFFSFFTYPFGRIEVGLPHGFISIGYGGRDYYYGNGLFYRRHLHGYMVVPAPVGVTIAAIPSGCHKVLIDGAVYFTYNGIYYQRVRGGYMVIQPPTPVIVQPASVVTATPSVLDQDSVVVNIPNSSGGYTSVTLVRSNGGFVGPQGEYYPTFPRIAQLQAMYGS